jgi:hypothetical protein
VARGELAGNVCRSAVRHCESRKQKMKHDSRLRN